MNKRKLDHNLVSEKIGYDYANKKMMIRVYDSLKYVVEDFTTKPTWTVVVKHMLTLDGMLGGGLCEVSINGYYSTIRKNLKDIKVIKYNAHKCLVKGENWNRFFGDEDWSWFKTNTNSGGFGYIVH